MACIWAVLNLKLDWTTFTFGVIKMLSIFFCTIILSESVDFDPCGLFLDVFLWNFRIFFISGPTCRIQMDINLNIPNIPTQLFLPIWYITTELSSTQITQKLGSWSKVAIITHRLNLGTVVIHRWGGIYHLQRFRGLRFGPVKAWAFLLVLLLFVFAVCDWGLCSHHRFFPSVDFSFAFE